MQFINKAVTVKGMADMDKKNWQLDLETYIRQGEPDQSEKSGVWKTAIGLQDVDGLKTSDYLLKTAKEHIEGRIDIKTAQKRVQSYYKERQIRDEIEEGTKEADIVSTRIAELLGERTFQFSPAEWKEIHRRLFKGVFDHAGEYRTYNITKSEWVLNGETVLYASAGSIKATLDYDFGQEKEFSYEGLSALEAVKHIAQFTSGIWQIHPFCEGNTRSTAVFIIKYLKTFGFRVNNELFAEKSWYFRNALARANYNDLHKGITSNTMYLERFFENLLMNGTNELKNRYIHVDYDKTVQNADQSATRMISKCNNCTLEELAIINELKQNPVITQKELALRIGKSERTIKTRTVEMQEKGLIRRENGKRNGRWEVLINT